MRKLFISKILLLILICGIGFLKSNAQGKIVISQVYGGGGNSGSTYKNDFIELFNSGNAAVSLNGWSVQYAGATGITWQVTNLTNVSLQPGHYYLVQELQGTAGTTNLPTPDATGTVAIGATAFKVALVNSTTALTGSGCPFAASVVDFVGVGSDCSETSPAPAPSTPTSILRVNSGCTDAGNNSTDFATGAPNPRNTLSPVNLCAIITANLGDHLPGNASVGHTNDIITYQDTIKNSGLADATGVNLNDPTPSGTTFNANSTQTSALARDDNYTAGTTSPFSANAANGVLINDFGLKDNVRNLKVVSYGTSLSNGGTTPAGSNGTTDAGGTININATTGAFTYMPPVGFAGFDKFKYIATTEVTGLPNNDAIVTISVGTLVTANADAYSVVGNVRINPTGSSNLLNNDAGTGKSVTAVNGTALSGGTVTVTTTNGGNLIVASNGDFTYNPAPGYEGTDNFTYSLDNGFNTPGTATVTLTVAGMVWYINNNSVNGDGRLTNPFNSIANFQAVNDGVGNHPNVNDNIFIYESGTNYTTGITLLQNQRFIGQDGSQSLSTITGLTPNATYSDQFPAMNSGNATIVNITNGSASSVTLATIGGNLIQGITINQSGSNAIITGASSSGNNTLKDVPINISISANGINLQSASGTFDYTGTGGISSTSPGTAFLVNSGSPTITISTSISQTGSAKLIVVNGTTSNTITFNTGTLSCGSSSSGISLINVNGNVTFSNGFSLGTSVSRMFQTALTIIGGTGTYDLGSFSIYNGSAVGLSSTTDGTINSSGGTIDVSGSSAIVINGPAGLANLGMTLTTVNSAGGSSNIQLDNCSGSITINAGTLSGAFGNAFQITGGTVSATYKGGITYSGSNGMVSVSGGHTTGTVTFNTGTLSATNGTGLQFDNADGIYNFNGTNTLNGGDAGIDLLNDCDGTFTFSSNTSITNPTGTAFNIGSGSAGTGGSCSVDYNGTISKTSSGKAIEIQNKVAGSVSFDGNVSGTTSCTGINLATNTGATINFTGAIILDGAASVFSATGGGTISATNTSSTIGATNVPSTTALNIANTTVGSAGLLFSSVSATSAISGISLTSVTGTGSITINGGILNSGGGNGVFYVTSGTPVVTYAGSVSQTANFPLVRIESITGGTVTLSGNLSSSASSLGISVVNNTGGTINFSGATKTFNTSNSGSVSLLSNTNATINFTNGGLNISSGSIPGFTATGGGTLNITGANNIISASSATGLLITGTNAGGSGITFASITSTSGQIASITTSTGTKTLGKINASSSNAIALNLNNAGTVNAGDATQTSTLTTSTGSGIIINSTTLNMSGIGVDVNATSSGIGVNVTGGTVAITGGNLNIVSSTGTGFSAISGGTVSITGSNNTISSGTGTALNVANTTIGASGLTFQSISANGGTNGIVLNTTGSSGGLTVTGTGTANSGGIIQNMTGADDAGNTPVGTSIVLYKTSNVSLSRMKINDNTNYGINGISVAGLTISNCIVTGVNGTNQATPYSDGSITLLELSGTCSINNTEVTGGYQRNIRVDNTLGTLDLTVNACNIHNTSSAQGDDGLAIEIGSSGGASNATLHVTNNTFSAHGGDHFDLTVLESPTVSCVFTGNQGNPGNPVHAIGLGQGFRAGGGAFNGSFSYDYSNNTIYGTKQGNAITINKGSGTGTFQGRVSGNTIGQSGVTLSGASQSNGISVESRGGGTHTTLVTGNTIRQYREYGINIEGAEAGTTTFNVTCNSNTIDEPGSPGAAGLSLHGIQANWGIDPGNTSTLLLDLGGTGALKNIVTNGGNEPAGGFDIRSRQRQSTTIKLLGYGGANNDNAAVNAYFTGRNTLTSVSSTNTVPTGGGYVNTASVPQPVIPN